MFCCCNFYVLILLNNSCSCHIISSLSLYFDGPEKVDAYMCYYGIALLTNGSCGYKRGAYCKCFMDVFFLQTTTLYGLNYKIMSVTFFSSSNEVGH